MINARHVHDYSPGENLKRQNSYIRALYLNELQRLVITALIQQTATLIAAVCVNLGHGDYTQEFFYGATLGFLCQGFFTDLLARGRYLYSLLGCIIIA